MSGILKTTISSALRRPTAMPPRITMKMEVPAVWLFDGLTPANRDMRAASRNAPDVPLDHRRPFIHWHLEESDRTRPAPP
jgi:hypothetical protein